MGSLRRVTVAVKDLDPLSAGTPTLRGSLAVDEKQAWRSTRPVRAPARAGRHHRQDDDVGVRLEGRDRLLRHGDAQPLELGSARRAAPAAAPPSRWRRAWRRWPSAPMAVPVRIPASFTGTAGLKPTFGQIPAFPLSPVGTIAHLGPICRTVDDTALLMSVIGQRDWRDWCVCQQRCCAPRLPPP